MAEKGNYTYEYPRPMVTVNAVIFAITEKSLSVLLIERKHEPYAGCWALPGGFVEMDERLEPAAQRELEEETGISGIQLDLVGVFDDPKRDPRGRSIGVAFLGVILDDLPEPTGGDDAARAAWFRVSELPRLAFDHDLIIVRCLEKISHDAACPVRRPAWYNEGILSRVHGALSSEIQHREAENCAN